MANNLVELVKMYHHEIASWSNTIILVELVPLLQIQSFKPPDIIQEVEYHYTPHKRQCVGWTYKDIPEQVGSIELVEEEYWLLKTLMGLLSKYDVVGHHLLIVEKVGVDKTTRKEGFSMAGINFINTYNLKLTTCCPMIYTRCCVFVLYFPFC